MITSNLLRTTRHSLNLDSQIPFLADALDCYQAQTQLCKVIPNLRRVNAATLVRHKLGRRALIEYQLTTTTASFTLLGKIRAKGTDWKSYRLQQALWQQGFAADSSDGYSVPQPIGIIPAWQMWLQRKVPGIPVTDRLLTRDTSLAHRIAGLAHKLHCTPIPTSKTHTLQDELRILHERLPQVSQQFPQWQSRIEQVLVACDQVASHLSTKLSDLTGIHRDFYGDQILVDCDRMWLVDLDLYCQGSPALDIGNFIAHITEQSLRQLGDPTAMCRQENVLQEAFVSNWIDSANVQTDRNYSAEALRQEIELYTVLTLVRHIYISTRIASRQPYSGAILSLCEKRLRKMM